MTSCSALLAAAAALFVAALCLRRSARDWSGAMEVLVLGEEELLAQAAAALAAASDCSSGGSTPTVAGSGNGLAQPLLDERALTQT